MYRLLIVDDEQSVRYSFRKLLNSRQYTFTEAADAQEAITEFRRSLPNLVILDIEMPGKDGIEVLKEIKEISPLTPVIIVTAYGSGDRVIKAMKYGAYEYIEKPFDIPRLISVIEDALKSSIQSEFILPAKELKPTYNSVQPEESLVGESAAIKEVFKLIGRVAASDASILIVGESGTGKELVARAIHKYSDRSARQFIAINCAAIPESLLESELFGFEKGAFTGADKQRAGKFEEADGGTLFLDEIGDMSLSLQSKLLRVLQEGTLERLGSSKTVRIDARIVAATNRNLEKDIVNKSFREDLYYRLKVITISLPPLRMRRDDIPLLTEHFLKKHSKGRMGELLKISPDSLKKLEEYSWPGNIRELENVIKRAIILAKGSIIEPEIPSGEEERSITAPQERLMESRLSIDPEILSKEGDIYRLAIDVLEKELIQWALAKTGRNQVRAAKLLGISRVMLHDRIDKFKLD